MTSVPLIQMLGQSGVRFATPEGSILVDPYLTDSVAETHGEHFKRLHPPSVSFSDLSDTRVILVTHAHLDHCDPKSILGILDASPTARIVAPEPARDVLIRAGLSQDRIEVPVESWTKLHVGSMLHTVPAAHPIPSRSSSGGWEAVGYILQFGDRRFYHAGDTSPDENVVESVRALSPAIGFIPVNERNYYREASGIIGNMSLREAFEFSSQIGLQTMIPIHWDLFAPNQTFREEIELIHSLVKPTVKLAFAPFDGVL